MRRNKNRLVRLTTRVETVGVRGLRGWGRGGRGCSQQGCFALLCRPTSLHRANPHIRLHACGGLAACRVQLPTTCPPTHPTPAHLQAREVLEKFLNDHDDMHDFNLTANQDREKALQEERDRALQEATAAGGNDQLGEVSEAGTGGGGRDCAHGPLASERRMLGARRLTPAVCAPAICLHLIATCSATGAQAARRPIL